MFEVYAIGISVGVLGILAYGAKRQESPIQARPCSTTLFAIVPMVLVVVAVLRPPCISAIACSMRRSSCRLQSPSSWVVTAYAIHQHRLFDIEFFIPWSKVRARKTAFYNRIRAMIAEIADLGSVRGGAPAGRHAALPGGAGEFGQAGARGAGGAQPMVAFPLEQLRQIDRIVVANEIADTAPQTCALMRQHNIAAIVPFYPPQSRRLRLDAARRRLQRAGLHPLDFKMVEQLFDKMAELFLDKLLFMRNQARRVRAPVADAGTAPQQAQTGIVALRGENETLRGQNLRLAREQAADSLLVTLRPEQTTLPSIVLLGRDKPLLKRLRRHFRRPTIVCRPGLPPASAARACRKCWSAKWKTTWIPMTRCCHFSPGTKAASPCWSMARAHRPS